MASTTYKTMDASDLGDGCTERDLGWFVNACRIKQINAEEAGSPMSDEEVTAWMWGDDGDWPTRAGEFIHPSLIGGTFGN